MAPSNVGEGRVFLQSTSSSLTVLTCLSVRRYARMRGMSPRFSKFRGSSKRLILRSKGDLARDVLPDMLILRETVLASPTSNEHGANVGARTSGTFSRDIHSWRLICP